MARRKRSTTATGESARLSALFGVLSSALSGDRVRIYVAGARGEQIEVPARIARKIAPALSAAIRSALPDRTASESPAPVDGDRELTTREAADLLGVSRPFLVKLLDAGLIEHRMVGTHRRVRLAAVRGYGDRVLRPRRDALDGLSAAAVASGEWADVMQPGEAVALTKRSRHERAPQRVGHRRT